MYTRLLFCLTTLFISASDAAYAPGIPYRNAAWNQQENAVFIGINQSFSAPLVHLHLPYAAATRHHRLPQPRQVQHTLSLTAMQRMPFLPVWCKRAQILEQALAHNSGIAVVDVSGLAKVVYAYRVLNRSKTIAEGRIIR